ncbi:MAG: hypothetical protein ACK54F_04730 [Planctomycetia bacterium]
MHVESTTGNKSPEVRDRPAALMGEGIHFLTRSCFVPMARIRNVFEIIELYGHDENFEPHTTPEFVPTTAPAGSRQKLDILAERIQRGMPLWHPEDSTESSGALVGASEA